MSEKQPWTIERIQEALRAPSLTERFLSEINKAPAHRLLHVFARWERIAKDMEAAFEGNDEIIARELRGDGPVEGSIDVTDEVLERAARIRSRHAA